MRGRCGPWDACGGQDDGGARDAYAIPVPELARAWPDVVGRLIIPPCSYRGACRRSPLMMRRVFVALSSKIASAEAGNLTN